MLFSSVYCVPLSSGYSWRSEVFWVTSLAKENDMVTTIELSEQQVAELRELTQQNDSTEAIRVAMRDYIRYARRMRLKRLSGEVAMIDNWRQLEQAEICDQKNDLSQ